MRRVYLHFFFLLIGTMLSFLCTDLLVAQDHYRRSHKPVLAAGMSASEVLSLWGAPGDKQKFEARRREKWLYHNAHVVFEQGKVVQWASSGVEGPAPVFSPAPAVATPSRVESSEAEALLSEILRGAATEDTPQNAPGSRSSRELAPAPLPNGAEHDHPDIWREIPEPGRPVMQPEDY